MIFGGGYKHTSPRLRLRPAEIAELKTSTTASSRPYPRTPGQIRIFAIFDTFSVVRLQNPETLHDRLLAAPVDRT